ncbi:MAG: hypothetical protein JSS40_09350 [Proteobacteria bacterium]|nr:hypothetical protein [Pseudomonadota bacterium]
MRIRALLLSLAASGLLSSPALGEDLGRLFFTPEQRSALDARRKARIPDKPSAVVVESPVTRVDGFVSRRGGKSTTWVNGEAVPEGTQPEGLRVRPKRNDTGRVIVNIGESETPVDLKIGQSFDRGTGEVRDSLEGGDIKINRRGPGGGK